MRADDLVPILAEKPDRGLTLQQGQVDFWDTSTGANTIIISGIIYNDLPVIGPITGIAAGNSVMVLGTTGKKYVLGKLTRP